MKLKFWMLIGLMIVTSVIVSCGGDEDDPVITPCACDPDTPETVLSNIEWAYNHRRIDKYNTELDQNFIFYLAPGDVGGNIPASWNRADEIDLTTNLFDKNYTALPCQSIYMDIRIEDGLSWTEIVPESAPEETWYSVTLYYDFVFKIEPNTYIPNSGSRAVFTVRNAAGAGEPANWQLVEMQDLGAPAITATTAASTEPTTWGGVKVMYR